MIVVMGVFNLACCVAIALTGVWLLTQSKHARPTRVLLGVITCGAIVNARALGEALCNVGYLAHAFVWPSEAMVNFGAAVMLLRWCRSAARPKLEESN